MPGWLEWILSAASGSFVTLIAFRTRLALMDRRISETANELKTERKVRGEAMVQLERRLDDRLEKMDRRSIEQLRITADIARKVGVDGRFSDAVIRMLADDGRADYENGTEPL